MKVISETYAGRRKDKDYFGLKDEILPEGFKIEGKEGRELSVYFQGQENSTGKVTLSARQASVTVDTTQRGSV